MEKKAGGVLALFAFLAVCFYYILKVAFTPEYVDFVSVLQRALIALLVFLLLGRFFARLAIDVVAESIADQKAKEANRSAPFMDAHRRAAPAAPAGGGAKEPPAEARKPETGAGEAGGEPGA